MELFYSLTFQTSPHVLLGLPLECCNAVEGAGRIWVYDVNRSIQHGKAGLIISVPILSIASINTRLPPLFPPPRPTGRQSSPTWTDLAAKAALKRVNWKGIPNDIMPEAFGSIVMFAKYIKGNNSAWEWGFPSRLKLNSGEITPHEQEHRQSDVVAVSSTSHIPSHWGYLSILYLPNFHLQFLRNFFFFVKPEKPLMLPSPPRFLTPFSVIPPIWLPPLQMRPC